MYYIDYILLLAYNIFMKILLSKIWFYNINTYFRSVFRTEKVIYVLYSYMII